MATKLKSIPQAWVNEKNSLLKEKLPKELQQTPFYPDANFYAQYYTDNLRGLHYMASVIFNLLKIEPNGCIIDFYDEKKFAKLSADTAGFYTKTKNEKDEEVEVILINSKYKNNPLAVGAILAHEMMHLYLFRLNLKLEDVRENELLTDLATINTGLSILILNGMSYSSKWYLTIILLIFGVFYRSSQELAFGYFKPKEYGQHAMAYLNDRHILAQDVVGYLNPTSRSFIQQASYTKGKNSTEFIKILEKKHLKSNIIKWAIVTPFIIFILYSWVASNKQDNLSAQIDTCKATVTALGNQANDDSTALDNMDAQMKKFQNQNNETDYDNLVDPYNTLLAKTQKEISNYETQLTACNNLVDQYNSNQ
ncbi:MAG: hypothetical protein PHS95_03060 [Candidatus Pacebacteria bacterium]|nr:hypothetical protein [Candidatus Paceibacterota bacterium]